MGCLVDGLHIRCVHIGFHSIVLPVNTTPSWVNPNVTPGALGTVRICLEETTGERWPQRSSELIPQDESFRPLLMTNFLPGPCSHLCCDTQSQLEGASLSTMATQFPTTPAIHCAPFLSIQCHQVAHRPFTGGSSVVCHHVGPDKLVALWRTLYIAWSPKRIIGTPIRAVFGNQRLLI